MTLTREQAQFKLGELSKELKAVGKRLDNLQNPDEEENVRADMYNLAMRMLQLVQDCGEGERPN